MAPFRRIGFSPRLAALALLLVTLLPFAAFVMASGGVPNGGMAASLLSALSKPSTRSALRFTLLQSAASTLLALVVGLPGAWLVGRFRFRSRRFLMALSAVPFCLPPLLVVLSFVAYYGKAGLLARIMGVFGLAAPDSGAFLYGFPGIVAVHAFYNFPLVVQTVGSIWSRIPPSREEAARTLGAGRFRAFISGTLPSLLPAIAQSASLVFLFCFFSFTVVLVFGGLAGSTLEVEIYRAVRFSGDRDTALALGLVQTIVALACTACFGLLDGRNKAVARDLGRVGPGKKPHGAVSVILGLYLATVSFFFLGPLFALALQAFTVRGPGSAMSLGFGNFARLAGGFQAPLPKALLGSLATAVPAALLAVALGLAASISLKKSRAFDLALALPLAISPAITALGWGYLFPNGAVAAIVLGQAAAVWPFAARSLSGSLAALDRDKRQAARTLGAGPLRSFLDADLPAIGPSVAAACAFSFSMAAGDTNVPLVLGRGEIDTLPLLIYRLASAYRFPEACAAGLILALLTGIAFFLKERGSDAP